MARCPYCDKRVAWWQPLTAWRDETLYCPHCMRALRVDRRRYGVLTSFSVAIIAMVGLLHSDHYYLLLGLAVALALIVCTLFGRVVKAEAADEG
jgi:hypothetical protein